MFAPGCVQLGDKLSDFELTLYPGTDITSGAPNGPLIVPGGKPPAQPKILSRVDCVRLVFDAPGPNQWDRAELTIGGLRRNTVFLRVPVIRLETKKARERGSFI